MVDASAAVGAAAITRKLPGLSVGLHFVEAEGVDLDSPVELTGELTRQLGRFHELAERAPTHIDSHHHVHLEGERMIAFASAAQELGVPVRGDGKVRYIGGFYGQWEWQVTDLSHVRPEFLWWLLREEVHGGLNEIACHPAADLRDLDSSYALERLVELETLTQPGLRACVEREGISLESYAAGR
jgi:predicted glycoside hydrolase/deacetylase ChbG (UPF0249 family)